MDLTSNMERFLDAQIKLIVIFTTHYSVGGLNMPGSESMVFHGIFSCSFGNLTVAYSGKALFMTVIQSILKTKSAIAILLCRMCFVQSKPSH